jgi:hypothetical protein
MQGNCMLCHTALIAEILSNGAVSSVSERTRTNPYQLKMTNSPAICKMAILRHLAVAHIFSHS